MGIHTFDLRNHNRLYEEWHAEHGENCLCKRFKDGDAMWQPRAAADQQEPPDDKKEDRDPEVRKLLREEMRKDEEQELGGKKFKQLSEL